VCGGIIFRVLTFETEFSIFYKMFYNVTRKTMTMECQVEIIDGKLILPEEMKGWIEAGESVTAFLEGDTLILKRKKTVLLSQIAEKGPNLPEPALSEIAYEVHAYRKEKLGARGA
jgi:hypothetical protein